MVVINIKERALPNLLEKFGSKRHPLCSTCRVKSLPKQEGTCGISYAPKAWFTEGRRCPRLDKQEVGFKKLRRGTEG